MIDRDVCAVCLESENPPFSHILYEHGYLTYCSTYVLEIL